MPRGKKRAKEVAASPVATPATDVEHGGFLYVRVTPSPAGVDSRADLADRMIFTYTLRKINEHGTSTVSAHTISLYEIVNCRDARFKMLHTAAFFDFLLHLFTAAPVGFDRLQYLLGTYDPLGSFNANEHARLTAMFEVHARAQQEAEDNGLD